MAREFGGGHDSHFRAAMAACIFCCVMATRKRPPLTVLSAFTGAGGLDLGLECAGFETLACIELDERARDTIIANRPHWNPLETGDILQAAYELRPCDVGLARGELSVLAGGPPCQPFSTAAQWSDRGRTGLDDPRSLSLLAFLHLAETFLPHVILVENVPGFVLGHSSALGIIADELGRINAKNGTCYNADVRVLSAEHFGVPQRRRRAIIVARRDGNAFAWPKPTHIDAPVRAYDALADIRPASVPVAKGQWADLLPSIPAGMNYQYHTSRGGGKPLFGHRRRFWSFLLKLAPDQPSWTISAQPGPATGPFHWDNRPLATEELARLQSFPRNWAFEGRELAKRRQIGNATPPLLAEIIGRAIAGSVFSRRFRSNPRLAVPRRRMQPSLPAIEPVPDRFLARLNKQENHPGQGRGPGAARRQTRLLLEQLAIALDVVLRRVALDQIFEPEVTAPAPRQDPLLKGSHARPDRRRSELRTPKRGPRSSRAA
jgi:DNA (cytosine-5)-methyltransferase 1